jgi:hypothetical protein
MLGEGGLTIQVRVKPIQRICTELVHSFIENRTNNEFERKRAITHIIFISQPCGKRVVSWGGKESKSPPSRRNLWLTPWQSLWSCPQGKHETRRSKPANGREAPMGVSKALERACAKAQKPPLKGTMRPGFPPGLIGDLLGSTLGVRGTDSCWTIHSSVGSLVLEHAWRNSSGTSDGGCRMPASLAAWTGTDRGGA